PAISTLSLHDALPISPCAVCHRVARLLRVFLDRLACGPGLLGDRMTYGLRAVRDSMADRFGIFLDGGLGVGGPVALGVRSGRQGDRKSTRLNSSHRTI